MPIPCITEPSGVVRYSDKKIAMHFSKENIVKLDGKPGTIIIFDTSGITW